MTRLRTPVVAGLAAGAGTTTVATVLHGIDAGVAANLTASGCRPADVLVARDDPASLRLLADAAVHPGTVAVVVLGPGTHAPLAASALRAVRTAARVVAVPHVARLAEEQLPHVHLEMLLAREPESLPEALRPYAEALAAVAAALVSGGRLAGDTASEPPRPAVYELDDEALERAAS